MTEAKQTPGPWRVGYSDNSGNGEDGFYCVTASDTECVVRSGDSFGLGYGIENAADARLIAAAPDMLEALESVHQLWAESAGLGFDEEMKWPSPVGAVWNDVRAAIRKATGAQ